MTIRQSTHGGQLKRYEVDVECKTRDSRVQQAYHGTRTNVLVFATSREHARATAVEKMTDKWYRHQGVRTEWTAHTVREA
jgi:hypothetical protein